MTLAESIAAAHEVQAKIDALYAEIDILLDPVLANAATMTPNELVELIDVLPRGFHRTELRTILNNRNAKVVS